MALLGLDAEPAGVEPVLASRPLPDVEVVLGLPQAAGADQHHGKVVRATFR